MANTKTEPIRVLGLFDLMGRRNIPHADHTQFGVPAKLLTIDDLHAWADTITQRRISTIEPISAHEYALGVRVPDDPHSIAVGTDILLRTFMTAIECFCHGASGNPVYWRIKPDMDSWIGELVEYREDGPDICNITDKRCLKDYSHRYVKVRARIAVDNNKPGTPGIFSSNDGVPEGWKVVSTIPDDNAIACVKV